MIAMGYSQDRELAERPDLKRIYESYLMCRSTQLVVFRKPVKGSSRGEEKIVTVIWPTGFTTYPAKGGWDDQSYLTTRLFMAALRGEQQGTARMMAKA
jgi:hypothetical protein